MKKAKIKVLLMILLALAVVPHAANAQPDDKAARAETLLTEAETLLSEMTFEAAQKVIAKSDQALTIYEELKDREKLRLARSINGMGYKQLGSLYLDQDDYTKAKEHFEKALAIFRDATFAYGEALALHDLGVIAVQQDDPDKALSLYEQAAEAYEIAGEILNRAVVYKNLGYLSIDKKNTAKAIGFFEKSLILLRQTDDRETLAEIAEKLGDMLLDEKIYDKAIEFYLEALPAYRELENRNKISYVLHNLGFASSAADEIDDAIGFYEQAADAYRNAGNSDGEASVLRNVALIYNERKNHEKAREFFSRSLKIERELKDTESIADLLSSLGDSFFFGGKYKDAEPFYAEMLAVNRQRKNRDGEVAALYNLGLVNYFLYQTDKAIDFFNQSREIYRELRNEKGEASALLDLGKVFLMTSRYDESRGYIEQALAIYRRLGDEANQAHAHFELGRFYQSVYRNAEAKSNYEQALALYRKNSNRDGEANSLIDLSGVYSYENDHEKALDLIEAARKIFVEIKNRHGEVRVHNELALTNYYLSRYEESLRQLDRAFDISKEIGDEYLQADALSNFGMVYDNLGQFEKSIEFYTRALDLYRKNNVRFSESIVLSNIGFNYYRQQKYDLSKKFTEQGIEIMRAEKMRLQEGYALHNLGLVYYKQKNYKKALELYDQGGAIYFEMNDRRPESYLYDSYGELYRDMGEYDKAFENLEKAVALCREIKHNEVEANALTNLMLLFEVVKQPRIAIFYGKQAVNLMQSVRRESRGLDKDSQKTLLKSYEKTYRKLADLLMEQGRLPEAQQVLEMLNDREYSDFLSRDADEAAKLAKIAERPDEKEALEKYSLHAKTLAADAAELAKLEVIRNNLKENEQFAEKARFDELKKRIEAANKAFRLLLEKTLSLDAGKTNVDEIKRDRALQGKLAKWGDGTVALYTLIAEERYRVILTTPKTQVDGKTDIPAVELNKKIADFRRILLDRSLDPRPLGKELYEILIKPVEGNLEAANAKTLLWSLNGALSYIPIGALYDGERYFAEKYQNVVITSTTRTSLDEDTDKDWRVLGAGVTGKSEVTEPYGEDKIPFKALPAVSDELQTIIQTETGKNGVGILPGVRLLDAKFTEDALKENVASRAEGARKYNVIHFATHFHLGSLPENSFLLLGNNEILTLEEVNDSTDLELTGIELVTLSACNTGFGGITGISTDGNKAVDSLAAFIESRGAKSVIATLWAVEDESTALLMSEFYRLRKENPEMTKAEAIQSAQKKMMAGELKPKDGKQGDRSGVAVKDPNAPEAPKFAFDENKPYAHPLFWSPFVLIGNWR